MGKSVSFRPAEVPPCFCHTRCGPTTVANPPPGCPKLADYLVDRILRPAIARQQSLRPLALDEWTEDARLDHGHVVGDNIHGRALVLSWSFGIVEGVALAAAPGDTGRPRGAWRLATRRKLEIGGCPSAAGATPRR